MKQKNVFNTFPNRLTVPQIELYFLPHAVEHLNLHFKPESKKRERKKIKGEEKKSI